MALRDIQMRCKGSSWYIKSSIDKQLLTMNHHILVKIIRAKVDDQAFIDLLYKYLKVEHSESIKQAISMKIGVSQSGLLSLILANIYMHSFDEWIENHLILNFNKVDKRKKNPGYFKKYYKFGLKVKDKSIKSILNMSLK